MEITFNEIAPVLKLYNEKMKDLDGQKLPLKVAFKLAVIIREFGEYQEFFQDRMNSIISNYGMKDEEGNYVYTDESKQMIKLRPESVYTAQKEVRELNDMKKSINAELLNLDDLDTLKEILTIEDLVILSPIVA